MGDQLGSSTDIDRLLVSSGLSTPIFTLIGNDDFWSCHRDFTSNFSAKNGTFFSYFGRLGVIESSQNVWTLRSH